jgi:methylated-DNA-[protein]-cysteine S-methyltransferase
MSSFNEKCYKILLKVPKGKVTTYKAIARKLNSKAYRAVGNAMNKNPYCLRPRTTDERTNYYLSRNRSSSIVSCHRVVNSNGEVGGFASGTKKKIKMLRKEGVEIKGNKIINFKKYLHKF